MPVACLNEGPEVSGQDQPLENRESGLWIPASQHQAHDYDDEDDEIATSTVDGETRGREEHIAA